MRLMFMSLVCQEIKDNLLHHNNGMECSSMLKCARIVLQDNFLSCSHCFNIHLRGYKAETKNTISTHEVAYPSKGS